MEKLAGVEEALEEEPEEILTEETQEVVVEAPRKKVVSLLRWQNQYRHAGFRRN